MKIVILGAGKVGGSLARNLSNSDYQVSIVDEDKLKLSALEERLDIMTVEGHAAKPNSISPGDFLTNANQSKVGNLQS